MSGERIVIVGAGIAGAATAWHLAAAPGSRQVLVLEREPDPGRHATGRNAAILRSLMPDPLLGALAAESVPFFRDPPAGFAEQPLLDPVGLFLGAPAEHAGALRSWAVQPRTGAVEVSPAELYRRIPALAPGIEFTVHQPDEGVVDVHALLHGFLRGARAAGAELRLVTPALRLHVQGGRVAGLDTPAGRVPADKVVLAGGGWAARLAAAAGFPMPLVPYRRHILVTQPLRQVDPRWPVLWIAGDEFYFRPESGGLMMSACDKTPVDPDEGEVPDPSEKERIAALAARWLPAFAGAGAAHFWAGMRTYAPDERFLIGPDPRCGGLYWCAGLAGHGITCAPAAGALAAAWIVTGASRHPAAQAMAPSRLLVAPAPVGS
ncbi:MAG: FAD-binding oxidoreductase [Planctomycetota bacterium]|nr:MAG: FAD-binding oxidoreductase [Planctomycetota bacterium]